MVSHSKAQKPQIGVIGLGYVGLTLGLTFADLGFEVLGVDASSSVRESLAKGIPHFFENGLPELLKKHIGKSFKLLEKFTKEQNASIYFVAVGTPYGANALPNLSYLEGALDDLAPILKKGDLIILRSTVPLGTTQNLAVRISKKSGLVPGEDFFIAFGPERTVEGNALEELRTLPQVVGGINKESTKKAEEIFKQMTAQTVTVDSLEEAEMVKLVNNAYRDVTFAFSMEMWLIAHNWGLNAKNVIKAANFGYPRSSAPMPGPGVGGYCLTKDPYLLAESSRQKGFEPKLILEARELSARMITTLSDEIQVYLKKNHPKNKNPKILLLGFAFKGKPATSDVRGSRTLSLIKRLVKMGYTNLYGYDPVVDAETIQGLGVKPVRELAYGYEDSAAIVVMNDHEELESIDMNKALRGFTSPVLLLDAWGLYDKTRLEHLQNVTLFQL